MPRKTSQQQHRLACDRCHLQKLRCQRQHGQGSCQRCSRLNAVCVFGPRQPRRAMVDTEAGASHTQPRPPPAQSPGEDTVEPLVPAAGPTADHQVSPAEELSAEGEMGFGADLDAWWGQLGPASPPSGSDTVSSLSSMLGIDLQGDFGSGGVGFDLDPALTGEASGPALDGITTTSSASLTEHHGTQCVDADVDMDPVHYVRQLADLNVRLCEHMNMLPPLDSAASTPGMVPSPDGLVFPIDETFSLTQSLIDHLKHLYPPSVLDRTCPKPDQSTLLLIMSCSGRVFDIYEVIFGHMSGCVNHNITPVTSAGKTMLLPQVRIGAYTPPTAAAIAMQMLLIVLLAAELFDQLQEALGVWRHRRAPTADNSHSRIEGQGLEHAVVGPKRRYPDFAESTRSEMEQRATTVAAEIGNMRQRLLSLPGMAGAGALQALLSNSR